MSKNTCTWKRYDDGQFGIPDWEYNTDCGKRIDANDADKVMGKYCQFCGLKIKLK